MTAEFKAQALELLAAGKPVSALASELCVSTNLLYNWRQDARRTQARPAPLTEPVTAEDWRALRRELTLLRQENDIFKKAAIILGTRPPTNSAL